MVSYQQIIANKCVFALTFEDLIIFLSILKMLTPFIPDILRRRWNRSSKFEKNKKIENENKNKKNRRERENSL